MPASTIVAGVLGAFLGGAVCGYVAADYFLDVASRNSAVVSACRLLLVL